MTIFLAGSVLLTKALFCNTNCHPDRSVAQWRDLRFSAISAAESGLRSAQMRAIRRTGSRTLVRLS